MNRHVYAVFQFADSKFGLGATSGQILVRVSEEFNNEAKAQEKAYELSSRNGGRPYVVQSYWLYSQKP